MRMLGSRIATLMTEARAFVLSKAKVGRAVYARLAFAWPLTLEGERGAPVNVRARLRRPFFGTAGKTTRSFPAYLSSSTEAESVPLCRGESEREEGRKWTGHFQMTFEVAVVCAIVLLSFDLSSFLFARFARLCC